MTPEEYVRSRWERSTGFRIASPNEGMIEVVGARLLFNSGEFGNMDDFWDGAYAFTLDREEEIRQLAGELGFVLKTVNHARQIVLRSIAYAPYEPFIAGQVVDVVRWSRILSRLQSTLAEMRKGMK
jgi:hypothetical protein